MTGQEIRQIRKDLGMSQSKFAAWLGVSVLTIKRWESGHRKPGGPVVRLIRLLAIEQPKTGTARKVKWQRTR